MNRNIEKELLEMQDLKYREFHSSLCPSDDKDFFIGVRNPILKQFAKDILKENDNDARKVLNKIEDNYYEEILLQGLLISFSKNSLEEKIELSREFIPKIMNWAVCDTFCASFKFKKEDRDTVWKFIMEYKNSSEEYEKRFLIVMMLDHFIDKEHIQDIFSIVEKLNDDRYYVKMGIAWCISICYIKMKEETEEYLKKSKLDNWTYNKALQKAIESYRVSLEDKNNLRQMKRK